MINPFCDDLCVTSGLHVCTLWFTFLTECRKLTNELRFLCFFLLAVLGGALNISIVCLKIGGRQRGTGDWLTSVVGQKVFRSKVTPVSLELSSSGVPKEPALTFPNRLESRPCHVPAAAVPLSTCPQSSLCHWHTSVQRRGLFYINCRQKQE